MLFSAAMRLETAFFISIIGLRRESLQSRPYVLAGGETGAFWNE